MRQGSFYLTTVAKMAKYRHKAKYVTSAWLLFWFRRKLFVLKPNIVAEVNVSHTGDGGVLFLFCSVFHPNVHQFILHFVMGCCEEFPFLPPLFGISLNIIYSLSTN